MQKHSTHKSASGYVKQNQLINIVLKNNMYSGGSGKGLGLPYAKVIYRMVIVNCTSILFYILKKFATFHQFKRGKKSGKSTQKHLNTLIKVANRIL
jgi:hypothetical protein